MGEGRKAGSEGAIEEGREARGGAEGPQRELQGTGPEVNPTLLTNPPSSQTLGPSGSPSSYPLPFLRVFPAARIPVLQSVQI